MPVHKTYIAGIKFNPGASDILKAMDESAEFELRPEPENKFDENAIAVYYDGNKIGFIPGFMNEMIGELISENRIDIAMKAGNEIEIHYDGGLEND